MSKIVSCTSKNILTLLFILISNAIFSQPIADSLIAEVINKNKEVNSFRADVSIDVDVDFINIPIKKGRIFFKAPDKFKFRLQVLCLFQKRP